MASGPVMICGTKRRIGQRGFVQIFTLYNTRSKTSHVIVCSADPNGRLFQTRRPFITNSPRILRKKEEDYDDKQAYLLGGHGCGRCHVAGRHPRHGRGFRPDKGAQRVLVHGLFADGSCWSEVIPRLQAAGLNVTSVQNPLTTLEESVAAAGRVLALQEGPTVLVGHSFSGMIVTEAGVDPKVSALVYVAARAPDAGEDTRRWRRNSRRRRPRPASFGRDDWERLSEEAFLRDFAGDLPREKARVLYAVQEPFHKLLEREDNACGMAIEAELLRGLNGGPHDQSGPRALHGEADGRQDDRGEGQPSLTDLPSRRNHGADS